MNGQSFSRRAFLTAAATTGVGALLVPEVAEAAAQPAQVSPDTLMPTGSFRWKGLEWQARTWPGAPAVNGLWSPDHVWVDEEDRLHLRVDRNRDGELVSAEAQSVRQGFGYGRYRFVVDSSVAELPRNAVAGMFTYSGDSAFGNREIDFEASAWGSDGPVTWNHTYFQQRGDTKTPVLVGEQEAPHGRGSSHELWWIPDRLHWRTWSPVDRLLMHSSTSSHVPLPGDEHVLLNLWVLGGEGWTESAPAELVLSDFSFEPLTSVSTPPVVPPLLLAAAVGREWGGDAAGHPATD